MKCTRCHRNMERKSADDGSWYWECPRCHRTIARVDSKENPDPAYDMTGLNVEVVENETTQN